MYGCRQFSRYVSLHIGSGVKSRVQFKNIKDISCIIYSRRCSGVTRRPPPSLSKNIVKKLNTPRPSLLSEDTFEETFTKGTGPGGQKINKVKNCVVLKHIETGIQVRVQKTRKLEENRKIARRDLALKVDSHLRGKDSFLGVRAAIQQDKKKRKKAKAKRRLKNKKTKKLLDKLKTTQIAEKSVD